jgi:SmpA / OmlA family
MSRRTLRRLLLILALAVLVAASGSFLLPRGDARITQANCDKIREGMTKQEVEAILGPPGNYTGWPHAVPESSRELVASGLWVGEDGIILVSFDGDEKVDFVYFLSAHHCYKDRRGRFMDWLRDLGDRFKR